MIVSLLIVFAVGASAASLANAATYEWAWNRRRLSAWQPAAEGVAPRGWLDRLPIVGWLRLRRDAAVLGRGFWVRPMLVEIAFGAALAALYWWEVGQLGLIEPQLVGVASAGLTAPTWSTLAGFATHAVLAWLMLVASLIDIDEKTIPDEVTVPGMLVGLVLATLLPGGMLPNVEEGVASPIGSPLLDAAGKPLTGPLVGNPLWLEPTHIAAPNGWPEGLDGGAGAHGSLLLGVGCYALWCFALTPRYLRTSRGLLYGLAVVLRRVLRSLRARPLREIFLAGVLLIAMVWFTGGDAWRGLLTALVGAIASGGIVWAVRIVGSAALGREAMGFGDVTLMMMIGAFLGWQAGLAIFVLAPLAALVVGVTQVVLRSDDEIPYGPFLCLATAGVVVGWGTLWPRIEDYFALGSLVPTVLILCVALLGLLLAVWRQIKLRVLGMSETWDDE